MLLIDGVKYEFWTPPNEDEFEQVVKEHAQEIFGGQSIYLDRKQKLKSLSGVGSIPDGYVVIFGDTPQWHIVEVELSSHPLYDHIVSQASKFINGISNPNIQRGIANGIHDEIARDDFTKLTLRKAIEPVEVYKFLADLISQPPVLTIIIDEDTQELREALNVLHYYQIKVVEFQTFVREGVGLPVHAHLFEPLYKIDKKGAVEEINRTKGAIKQVQREGVSASEIKLKITFAAIRYGYIPFPMKSRRLFPGYDEPFMLITDIGEITTHVTGAPTGTQIGDLDAGNRIGKNLKPWYKNHPGLQPEDELIIRIIEPMKRYRLEIIK